MLTTPRFDDTAALERPPDRAEIAEYRRRVSELERRAMGVATKHAIGATITYGLLILTVVLVPAGLPFMTGVLLLGFPDGSGLIGGTISLVVAGVVAGLIGATYGRWQFRAIQNEWAYRGSWTLRWRLAAFGRANRLFFRARPTQVPTVGSILQVIGARYYDAFSIHDERGGHMFVNALSESTQFQSPTAWGVISIALDRAVPPLLFVPKVRTTSAVARIDAIGARKRLKLEGDFDKHFTLYAPANAEREALYIVTPDLMAIIIDHLPGSYVETMDATLVITSPRPLRFERAQTWDEIATILAIVSPKAARQTRRLKPELSPLTGGNPRVTPAWQERLPVFGAIAIPVIVILQLIARLLTAHH